MIVIAYSSNQGYTNMLHRMERIVHSEWGINCLFYTRELLEDTYFYRENKKILDIPKGNGLWAWKPYIIMDALNIDPEVIYLDSSVVPSKLEDLTGLMNFTQQISSIETQYTNGEWTKRSCFVKMNCDFPRWWNSHQVWAGVVSAKEEAADFLNEWLQWCLTIDVISDDPCEGNLKGFIEHRHDQSILTNLMIMYNQLPMSTNPGFRDVVDYEAK